MIAKMLPNLLFFSRFYFLDLKERAVRDSILFSRICFLLHFGCRPSSTWHRVALALGLRNRDIPQGLQ